MERDFSLVRTYLMGGLGGLEGLSYCTQMEEPHKPCIREVLVSTSLIRWFA